MRAAKMDAHQFIGGRRSQKAEGKLRNYTKKLRSGGGVRADEVKRDMSNMW